MSNYCIKSRDLVDSIPVDFPHPELINGRWQAWPVVGRTYEACLEMIRRQITKPSRRPVPDREYRIFKKDGRKLTLLWEGKRV